LGESGGSGDTYGTIRQCRIPSDFEASKEEHFQGVLVGLAARCYLSRSLLLREVRSEIGELTPDSDIEAILHDLARKAS
jgi:hypothetical protein